MMEIVLLIFLGVFMYLTTSRGLGFAAMVFLGVVGMLLLAAAGIVIGF